MISGLSYLSDGNIPYPNESHAVMDLHISLPKPSGLQLEAVCRHGPEMLLGPDAKPYWSFSKTLVPGLAPLICDYHYVKCLDGNQLRSDFPPSATIWLRQRYFGCIGFSTIRQSLPIFLSCLGRRRRINQLPSERKGGAWEPYITGMTPP
ncbi:hypothetical protein BDV26DRAFT_120437 [Aspergillus bertholletiae]|uniref:Uncharacterized protein n=1 Tax=Aspergillus bertholletiae TaxID=1226010 RepID=A0A5N7AQY8_9EURO|nr:hypothetical protein BDV26DRAFT_120437 [Aspergillus bertholletiae]